MNDIIGEYLRKNKIGRSKLAYILGVEKEDVLKMLYNPMDEEKQNELIKKFEEIAGSKDVYIVCMDCMKTYDRNARMNYVYCPSCGKKLINANKKERDAIIGMRNAIKIEERIRKLTEEKIRIEDEYNSFAGEYKVNGERISDIYSNTMNEQ